MVRGGDMACGVDTACGGFLLPLLQMELIHTCFLHLLDALSPPKFSGQDEPQSKDGKKSLSPSWGSSPLPQLP